jgi:anthranilate phosphoribosyltransferase
MKNAIAKILGRGDLTPAEAEAVMAQIMDGGASPIQTAGLLVALRMKGEAVDELTGFARAMRARSVRVQTQRAPLIDTCGTGGDTVKTFNISTAAAFVAAGAGVAVAKHGNRAATSKVGSADVLEALGASLSLDATAVGRCLDEIGIGFLFARSHHPAMKHVAPIRTELGVRTVFNALGPLTNPAGATRQVIGVYDPELCEPLAQVLANLGSEHVLVVHGMAGLDEIATFGPTRVAEFKDGALRTYTLTAADLGLPEADPAALAAGDDALANGAILAAVLHGDDRGPRRDIVCANAGAALYVAGTVDRLADGVVLAAETIDRYAAIGKLDAFIAFTEIHGEAAQ